MAGSERVDQHPLAGLSVLEVGADVAVRYCARLFAQMGARVARLETERRNGGNPAYEAWLDEDKTSAGNLEEGLAALAGGAARTLVIGGQDPDAVIALDQRLASLGFTGVRVGITWFGMTGPYARWRGNDAVVQALNGIAYAFGPMEGPPTLPQGHAPQVLAGVNGFIGALAALMAGADGPARVDVSILDSALCLGEPGAATNFGDASLVATRTGVNRFAPIYPNSTYATADGFVGVTCVTPAQWASMCALIERPDLAEAPFLATSLDRLICAEIVDEALVPLIAEKPTAWWVAAGERLRIPITPALAPQDLPHDPHWRARGSFAPIAGHGAEGPTSPFRFAHDGRAAPLGGAGPAPLAGVRVADFTMGWAGPLGARYLGDLGADVLKIESAGRPDWWRGWEIVELQDPPLHELPRHFMIANRSKRGLDLDLASPADRVRAEEIVRRSDVVMDNQGPGVMDRLGLGQTDQQRLRPGVISIAMPPFGFGGPLSNLRAYGSTVEQASGMPFINGEGDWAPCNQHVAYGDPVSGIYAGAAAMAALWARPRLGGAKIEVCQVECLFQLAADGIIADQVGGARRTGSRRPNQAPVAVVPAAGEDAWLAVVIEDQPAWRALCAAVGEASWSPDWTLEERRTREDAIAGRLAAWSRDLEPAEAAARLQAAGAPAAPVTPSSALHQDPHLAAIGYWLHQHRPYIGEHITPQPPMIFDDRRPPVTLASPVLGQHTDEVLAELGIA